LSKYNIVLDAMGGDNQPDCNIEGAVTALKENSEIRITLVGDETIIKDKLKNLEYDKEKISIVHSTEIITNEDKPTKAFKQKKDSSIVVGMNIVKNGEADGFVSAGSTGAVLTASTMIIGRIAGIKRPALGTIMPNTKGYSFLIDCGANVDAKAEYLHQYAKMGHAYMESVMSVKKPKIGLINVGAEEGKGNALTKEVFYLLKDDASLNFVGNVEARELPFGVVDVMVCDAFVGNVVLKHTEGMASALLSMIKDAMMSKPIYKFGAGLAKGAFKDLKENLSYEKYGGAPFLGLNQLVVKAHGSSSASAISGAINQCYLAAKNNLVENIKSNI